MTAAEMSKSFLARPAEAAVFDLDGVLVDTAPLHFGGWRYIAQRLGFDLPLAIDDQLRGVARDDALSIVLAFGGVDADATQRARLMAEKNDWFLDHARRLDRTALLPGAWDSLQLLSASGVKRALASASKNACEVLNRTGIAGMFDVIVDGTVVTNAKPDPEIFLKSAELLNVPASRCVVFEDAPAGVEGALTAGCQVIGIGTPESLPAAAATFLSLAQVPLERVFLLTSKHPVSKG